VANLEAEMERLGVRCPGDFVLRVEGQGEATAGLAVGELLEAMQHAIATAGLDEDRQARLVAEAQRFAATLERRLAEAVRGSPFQDVRAALGAVWRTRAEPLRALLRPGRETADQEALYQRMVELAAARNVPPVVARAVADPRYGAARHTKPPRKIGSQLVLYDCISCDKCIPVCPNDANFVYDVEPQDLEYVNYAWDAGRLHEIPGGRFTVTREHQIANYADFCNECGNCDVFCPEDGGPFVEKPRFFSSIETWQRDRGVGFYVRPGKRDSIWGRFAGGREYLLQLDEPRDEALFKSGDLELEIDLCTHRLRAIRGGPPPGDATPAPVDMLPYHVLRTLLGGVLDERRTNYLNSLRG
jgi:putative selenate reductase